MLSAVPHTMSKLLDAAHGIGSLALSLGSVGSLVWFGFQLRSFIAHAKVAYAIPPPDAAGGAPSASPGSGASAAPLK